MECKKRYGERKKTKTLEEDLNEEDTSTSSLSIQRFVLWTVEKEEEKLMIVEITFLLC